MRKLKTIPVIALALLASTTILSTEPEEGLTFYAPFDGKAKATVAGGNPAPAPEGKTLKEEYIPGVVGNARVFTDRIKYESAGNFSNERGALEMWINILDPGKDDTLWHNLFFEGDIAPTHFRMYLGGLKDKNNAIFWGIKLAKDLDMADWPRFPIEKDVGAWNHILLTWDNTQGVRFYLNGENSVRRQETLVHFTWQSMPGKDLIFGATSGNKIAIDELKIYNRRLSPEEVAAKYAGMMPLVCDTERDLVDWRVPQLGLKFTNRGVKDVRAEISWAVRTEGALNFCPPETVAVAAGQSVTLPANLKGLLPAQSGEIQVVVKMKAGAAALTKNLSCAYLAAPLKEQAQESKPELKLKLIKAFDCAKQYGQDEFCDDGLSKVVDSPLGKYRITGATQLYSRFAYRFFVENPNQLHLAEVEYPDDHEYHMEVMVDTAYGGGCMTVEHGLLVGGIFPNSNTIKKHRILFYPPAKECTIMFFAWPMGGQGASQSQGQISLAAVKRFKIYQVQGGLPATQMANLPPVEKRRTIGYQDENNTPGYEQFGGYALPKTVAGYYEFFQRWVDYARFIGQNLVTFPLMHYNGATYRSRIVGTSDRLDDGILPYYWLDLALNACAQAGLKFNGEIFFWNIKSLDALGGKVSEEEMWQGQDTVCAVNWNGEYEKSEDASLPNPRYNILHPQVRRVQLEFFREFLDRYGDYASLNGLDFWLLRPANIWLGSLKNGYDDFTITLFEKETGIKTPGAVADGKLRFIKRYVFLAKSDPARREKWIAWRCQKVRAYWKEMTDYIRSRRPDLKLSIQCWDGPDCIGEEWKPGKPDSISRGFREGGLDFKLFTDDPNMYIGNVRVPNMYTYGPGLLWRSYYFSEERILPWQAKGCASVWLHQQRRENDNLHLATPMPDYWLKVGQKSGRPNSTYGGHVEKSAPVMPHDDFYLEFYAQALADWDVREITYGGMGTTTLGAEDRVRDFARAYLTLPAEYFDKFKDVDDPVCARYRQDRFYLVNREFYPVKAVVKFNQTRFKLRDLPNDKELRVKDALAVEIGPYRVRSFKLPAGVDMTEVDVKIPAEKVKWLEERLKTVLANLDEAERTGRMTPRLKRDKVWYRHALAEAWQKKHYARLRQLLDHYYGEILSHPEKYKQTLAFFKDQIDLPEHPVVEALKVAAIPALDSTEWNQAPACGLFDLMRWEGQYWFRPAQYATAVRCLYSDQEIGFLYKCFDPDLARVKPCGFGSMSDNVELYLSPNENNRPYFHFKLCFDGARHQKRQGTLIPLHSEVGQYKPKYDVATGKNDDYWWLRVVIPFAELDNAKPPAAGEEWGLNLARQVRDEHFQAFRCYVENDKGCHCPELFAKLKFL